MSNLIQVYNNTLTDDLCNLIINTFENDIVNQFQGETLNGINLKYKKTVWEKRILSTLIGISRRSIDFRIVAGFD